MQIYDSLSETKKGLGKSEQQIRLFVCGITPYDYSHIGHARTYLAFDTIVKYLRSQGHKVFYLQNVTDVDDKIIDRSKKENTTWKELARRLEAAYHADEKALGITSVSKYARATDYIPQIISQVKTLADKGYAYKIDGDGYYFDVSKFQDYGKLAKRTAQQAEDGVSRIDESVGKRNKADFCLWKFSKPGEPSWKSNLGEGRPGWHIEDTAITEHFFGPQYDIHGGAIDLKFPHHEAEIAQQEAASGKKPLVDIWMHTGFLLVNGQKMSKSLGNFVTIEDFLKRHSTQTLRYLITSHHYRSPIDYSEKIAEQAAAGFQTLQNFVFKLSSVKNPGPGSREINDTIIAAKNAFRLAMDDDFNTPKAIAAIFDFINSAEKNIWTLTQKDAQNARLFIVEALSSLGLALAQCARIPLKIKWLVHKRESARKNKQFIQSDALRNRIYELGYVVEDTPAGPFVTPAQGAY